MKLDELTEKVRNEIQMIYSSDASAGTDQKRMRNSIIVGSPRAAERLGTLESQRDLKMQSDQSQQKKPAYLSKEVGDLGHVRQTTFPTTIYPILPFSRDGRLRFKTQDEQNKDLYSEFSQTVPDFPG